MKIDRRNVRHWWWLGLFVLAVLASIAMRPLRRSRHRRRVVLYGHRLAGNLLPIHRALVEQHAGQVEAAFLSLDPGYCSELQAQGVRALRAGSFAAVDWLSSADAIVSDHGLHAMLPLLAMPGIRFFDVWHGIPFKGFDADDFRVQHRFDEVWVASPLLERIYVDRFGFADTKVFPTGYARTDELVGAVPADAACARRFFGLPEKGKIILYAPTWRQDDAGRSLYPFGETEARFLSLLSSVAARHGATVVIRHHLNSGSTPVAPLGNLVFMPFSEQPLTERLLLATDILVCDWSSIAFDFLLLQRPTIFLDVPPPFRKPLSIDASFRYGAIAGNAAQFEGLLDGYLADAGDYLAAHGTAARAVRDRVYGDCADGQATSRCISRLLAGIANR